MRRHQEIESVAKEEMSRIVEEAKEKERAQMLLLHETRQEKTKLDDTIYRLKRCVEFFVIKGHMISIMHLQCKCSTGGGLEGDTGIAKTRESRGCHSKGAFCVCINSFTSNYCGMAYRLSLTWLIRKRNPLTLKK